MTALGHAVYQLRVRVTINKELKSVFKKQLQTQTEGLTHTDFPDYSFKEVLYQSAVCLIPLALPFKGQMYFILIVV